MGLIIVDRQYRLRKSKALYWDNSIGEMYAGTKNDVPWQVKRMGRNWIVKQKLEYSITDQEFKMGGTRR